MKARYVLVPLVTVIGGFAALVAFANRGSENDLALLETPAYPLVVIPRTALGKKPIIDWKLPIVGRIRIPSRVAPREYIDDPQVGGLMSSAIPYSPSSRSSITGFVWIRSFNQIDFGDNRKVELPYIQTTSFKPGFMVMPSYLALPYVFGRNPREVTLRNDPALVLYTPKPPVIPPAALRVRLPSNGLEPNLKPADFAVGPWKVRITPHWFSPSLPLLLDVQVLGLADGKEVWLRIEREGASGDNLKMRGSEVMRLQWNRWNSKPRMLIAAFSPKLEPRVIKVSIKELGGGKERVSALWEDGSVASAFVVTPTAWSHEAENPKSYVSVSVGRERLAGVYFAEQPNGLGQRWDPTTVKDGQILKAIGYRAVHMGVANIALPYPASKAFRSWEKEEDSY